MAVVFEETKTGWCLCQRPCVLLSGHNQTGFGIRLSSSVAFQPYQRTDDVQRRVFQVILRNVSYDEACRTLNVSTLSNRRVEQCKTLLIQITNQSHILHGLLPAKRDAQLIGRLRSAKL